MRSPSTLSVAVAPRVGDAAGLNLDEITADQCDDWSSRIGNSHLANYFGGSITSTIAYVVANGVFTKL